MIEYEYDFSNLVRMLLIITSQTDLVPPSLLVSNREGRRFWERNWFEIRN